MGDQTSVAPTTTTTTTTAQEDMTTAGQRKINLIWEFTQAIIALIVIVSNMIACIYMVVHRIPLGEYPPVMSSVLFLVCGAYFARTNHATIGGTGFKADQKYTGR